MDAKWLTLLYGGGRARLWHDDHMQLVHRSINYDFDKSGQFA